MQITITLIGHYYIALTCVWSRTCVCVWRTDSPGVMILTELDDCVSLLFPPSAAERPDKTRPLEKLRFPNSRLSVELEEEA